MKKRAFALLLSAALCLGLASTAFAAKMELVDDQYKIVDDDWKAPDTPDGPGSNGGGGGGSTSTSYSVTDGKGSNDKGSWTTDKTSAKAGETVTVIVTPNDGYKVFGVTVKDGSGSKVAVTNNGDGTYTFAMPASAVTVDVAFTAEYSAEANPFTDVAEDDIYYDAVMWAVENGITTGKSATSFDPHGDATRAQMVTYLWRLAGEPEPATTEHSFVDVDPDEYYYDAMLWALEEGITTGTTDTTFDPDSVVTRAQAVTFLYRYGGEPEVNAENPFADVTDPDAYYYDALLWAVGTEITTGTTPTTFDPANDCLRYQIVLFLYRYSV